MICSQMRLRRWWNTHTPALASMKGRTPSVRAQRSRWRFRRRDPAGADLDGEYGRYNVRMREWRCESVPTISQELAVRQGRDRCRGTRHRFIGSDIIELRPRFRP